MTWSYDRDADALYIELVEGVSARAVAIDAGTLVDFDERGRALGIEIIHPGRDWPLEQIAEVAGLDDTAMERIARMSRREGTEPFPFPAGGTATSQQFITH